MDAAPAHLPNVFSGRDGIHEPCDVVLTIQ